MDFICALFSHNCLTFASGELIVLLPRANKPGINLIECLIITYDVFLDYIPALQNAVLQARTERDAQ